MNEPLLIHPEMKRLLLAMLLLGAAEWRLLAVEPEGIRLQVERTYHNTASRFTLRADGTILARSYGSTAITVVSENGRPLRKLDLSALLPGSARIDRAFPLSDNSLLLAIGGGTSDGSEFLFKVGGNDLPDAAFNRAVRSLTGTFNDMAQLTDGSVILAGDFYGSPLLRITLDGKSDAQFSANAALAIDAVSPVADAVVKLSRDRVLVSGIANTGAVAFRADGTLDVSFVPPAEFPMTFFPPQGTWPKGGLAASYPNGKLLYISKEQDQPVTALRLNEDGSIDSAFNLDQSDPKLTTCCSAGSICCSAIATLPDGGAYIATAAGGEDRFHGTIVRLLPSGKVDPQFESDPLVYLPLQLLPLANSDLLLFERLNGDLGGAPYTVQRLNATGSLAVSFDGDAFARCCEEWPAIKMRAQSPDLIMKSFDVESSADLRNWKPYIAMPTPEQWFTASMDEGAMFFRIVVRP